MMPKETTRVADTMDLQVANKSVVKTEFSVVLPVIIQGYEYRHKFHVMPYGQTLRPCILGVPWLTRHKVNVDIINSEAVFHGQDYKLPFLQVQELQELHRGYEQQMPSAKKQYPTFGWKSKYYKKPEPTRKLQKQVWVRGTDIDQARSVQGSYYQVWLPKSQIRKEQLTAQSKVETPQLMQGTRQNWSPKRQPIHRAGFKSLWVKKEDTTQKSSPKKQWIWQAKSQQTSGLRQLPVNAVPKTAHKRFWKPKKNPAQTKAPMNVWRPKSKIEDSQIVETILPTQIQGFKDSNYLKTIESQQQRSLNRKQSIFKVFYEEKYSKKISIP